MNELYSKTRVKHQQFIHAYVVNRLHCCKFSIRFHSLLLVPHRNVQAFNWMLLIFFEKTQSYLKKLLRYLKKLFNLFQKAHKTLNYKMFILVLHDMVLIFFSSLLFKNHPQRRYERILNLHFNNFSPSIFHLTFHSSTVICTNNRMTRFFCSIAMLFSLFSLQHEWKKREIETSSLSTWWKSEKRGELSNQDFFWWLLSWQETFSIEFSI